MAKLADYFDKQDEAGVKYTVLDLPYSQKEVAKKAAADMGNPKMLEFNRDASEWRLIGDLVPKGTKAAQVDAAFGQWKTPEAAAAVAAERAEFEARKASKQAIQQGAPASEKAAPDIDPALMFWSTKANRKEFNDAIAPFKAQGINITYNAKVRHNGLEGAFVAPPGTKGLEALAAFQTPAAQAAWKEAGRESTARGARSDGRKASAESDISAQALEAEGKFLMAASVKGFALPSKDHPAERSASEALIKGADDKELSAAFDLTEVAKKRLEAKLYGIQISVVEKEAASARGRDLTDQEIKTIRSDFNKMDAGGRREAAKFIGLDNAEFGQLVGVRNGFFAIREEMVGRGLMPSKEQALAAKAEREQEAGKSAAPAAKTADKTAEAEKPKQKAQTGALAAALQNAGQGR